MPQLISGWDYSVWKIATFGNPNEIWTNGLRTESVTSLSGDDRSWVVRMLMFGIENSDSDAAEALAAMGETSALPALQTALSTFSGDKEDRDRIAQAIDKLSLLHTKSGASDLPTPQTSLSITNLGDRTRMDQAIQKVSRGRGDTGTDAPADHNPNILRSTDQ